VVGDKKIAETSHQSAMKSYTTARQILVAYLHWPHLALNKYKIITV
jgi:hypothetical protein